MVLMKIVEPSHLPQTIVNQELQLKDKIFLKQTQRARLVLDKNIGTT